MVDKYSSLSVKRWTDDCKLEWDSFVNKGKNSSFLFLRDYMDYHSDRFNDHSLLLYRGPKLTALLPANMSANGNLTSHEGLTYGGFIFERDVTLREALECFRFTLQYLNGLGIESFRYKLIPRFLNTLPADEVEYTFFLLDARLYRRDCALVINYEDRLPFQRGRYKEIKKAIRYGVTLKQEYDFEPFWNHVLIPNLRNRHNAIPVHTVEEITLLARRFPDNIKLFSAYIQNKIVAGVVIYEKNHVAHCQYGSVSDEGRPTGALDYLFSWLIDDVYKEKKFFDFGTNNQDDGKMINHGMVNWKEGFGARTYVHDFYELMTNNYINLDKILLMI